MCNFVENINFLHYKPKFQQLKEIKQRVLKHVLPTYTTMSKHVFLYYVNKQIFALTESKANTHSH